MNRSVFFLALAQAIVQSGSIHLTTTGALIGMELSGRESASTWPASFHVAVILAMTMPASFFMSKWGRKSGFLFAFVMGLLGACLAALGVYKNKFLLFASGAAIMGFLTAFGNFFRFAAVEAVSENQKSTAISLVLTGGVLAAFTGPYLANWGASLFNNSLFTGGYALLIPMYLLGMLLVFSLTFPRPPVVQVSIRKSFRDILGQPQFLGIVFLGTAAYLVMVLIMTATPLAMHKDHMGLTATTQVIRGHLLGMFVPSFFTGGLIRKYGVRRIIFAGALLFAFCIGINFHGVSYWHYLSSLVLLGIGWNFLFVSASQMLTTRIRANHQTAAQALNDFMITIGLVFAIGITGKLHESIGWQWLNVVTIPFIPGFIVVGWLLTHKKPALQNS